MARGWRDAHWLRVLSILPEAQSSVSSTCVSQLTAACTSISKEPNTLLASKGPCASLVKGRGYNRREPPALFFPGMESTPGDPFQIKRDKGVSEKKRTVILLMATIKRAGNNAALTYHHADHRTQTQRRSILPANGTRLLPGQISVRCSVQRDRAPSPSQGTLEKFCRRLPGTA